MANDIYFKSSDVSVYPCAYRGANAEGIQFNQKSRLITEEGLTALGGSGDLAKSYIVSYADNVLKVIIKGYYFEIKNLNDYVGFKYLNIQTKSIETSGESQNILASQNSSSENVLDIKDGDNYIFTGICGSETAKTGCDSLQIFDDDNALVKNSCLPHYNSELGAFSTNNNTANTTNSTAFGNNNIVETVDGQFAVGKFNDDDGSLFIVGNGESDEKRANAFSVGGGEGTKINENTAITGTLAVTEKTTLSKNLEVNGAADFKDSLTIEKGLTLNDKLKVTKNGASVTGDSNVTGALDVVGKLSGSNLTISSTAELNGVITGKSDANFEKNINAFKHENSYITTLNEDGIKTVGITAEKITVNNAENKSSFEGAVDITKDLNVSGITNTQELNATTLNASKSVNISASKTETGTVGYGTIINKDGIVSNSITSGSITSTGTITAEGTGNNEFSGPIYAASSTNPTTSEVIVLSGLVDLIYPIGSIYTIDAEVYDKNSTSLNSLVCPLEAKIGGEWELIKDVFLHAEGANVNKVKNAKYTSGSDQAYYIPVKLSDSSTISIGEPYIRNLQWSDNSSDYYGGYIGWSNGIVGRKAEYWNDWNNSWDNSSFENAWKGKSGYTTTNYLWCESSADGTLTNKQYWKSDKLTATWYSGKGNSNRWTNAVVTSYDDNLNYTLYSTGMSVDQHILIAASDRYENKNDIAQEKITSPLLPADNKIIYDQRDAYKNETNNGYWGFYGGTNSSFSEDDISGVWANHPNSFQINMNHRHAAKMNINIEPSIKNCNEITDSSTSTANMPKYQKVYAWKRVA